MRTIFTMKGISVTVNGTTVQIDDISVDTEIDQETFKEYISGVKEVMSTLQ